MEIWQEFKWISDTLYAVCGNFSLFYVYTYVPAHLHEVMIS